MDLKDKRLWYVVAVIVVLLVIGYAAGWFGGTSEPEPQSQEQGTEGQETPRGVLTWRSSGGGAASGGCRLLRAPNQTETWCRVESACTHAKPR